MASHKERRERQQEPRAPISNGRPLSKRDFHGRPFAWSALLTRSSSNGLNRPLCFSFVMKGLLVLRGTFLGARMLPQVLATRNKDQLQSKDKHIEKSFRFPRKCVDIAELFSPSNRSGLQYLENPRANVETSPRIDHINLMIHSCKSWSASSMGGRDYAPR